MILVGERLATVARRADAPPPRSPTRTGARLAWVPRRAGERRCASTPARCRRLLPGGRPVTDDAARAEVERVWDASIPTAAGRDVDGDPGRPPPTARSPRWWSAASTRRPARPGAGRRRRSQRAGFVVSLECAHSAVTEHADVVLPVAPAAEKAGRFVNWEGRRRPFDLTLTGTGALSDGRVLDALADELDVDLGLPHVASRPRRAGCARHRLGTRRSRRAVARRRAGCAEPGRGRAGHLARAASTPAAMQDGDENLAGTAKPVARRARRRPPPPQSVSPTATGDASSTDARLDHRAGGRSADCPTGSSGCRPTRGAARCAPTSARGAGDVVTLTRRREVRS